MSIIKNRSPRFVTIPSETVRDPDLSGDLLGLLVFLLDFPSDWNVSISWLVAQHKFGANSKVCNDMKRLRALGYARLTKHNDGTTEWDITSTKGVFEPDSGNWNEGPDSQNRNLRNCDSHIPETGTHPHKGIDTKGKETQDGKNTTRRAKKSEPKTTPEMDLLSRYGIEGQLADDYRAHRKAKRAPITETALQGLQREADKAGLTVAEAAAVTIERNWQGFKAEWHQKAPAGSQPTPGLTSHQTTRPVHHEANFRFDNSAPGKVARAIAERDARRAGLRSAAVDSDALDGEYQRLPY